MTAHVPEPDPAEAAPVTKPTYEFDGDFQTKIAALQLRDQVFARRTDGLVEPDYFANEAQATLVKLSRLYYKTYKRVPDTVTLIALIKKAVETKKIRKDMVEPIKEAIQELRTVDISDRDFVIEEVAEFAKHQATEEAILKSVSALEKRDFKSIEALIKKAMNVGISDGLGEYDYFEELENRTQRRIEIAAGTYKHNGISTGYPELDKYLYHRGWGISELSALMGAAKAGKSMSLGSFGLNACMTGINVLYLSHEVSGQIIADRNDANLSDCLMNELSSKPHEVKRKIEALRAKMGQFKIHQFPSGTCKPSQVRRLLDLYANRGIFFKMVINDYADIMAPEHRVDSNIENSKNIWLELRAIAQEYEHAGLTATQTNREGAKRSTALATDVAEDFNKIRIADLVLGINSSDAERSSGEARISFVAVRNGEDGFQVAIRQDRGRMKFITKVIGRV